jgi:hypothetical protein
MAVAGMAVVVIDCAAAVDAAATILRLLLTAAAKTPSLLLPLTVAAVDDDRYCHHPLQTTAGFWRLSSLTVVAAMAVMDGGNSSHCRQQW